MSNNDNMFSKYVNDSAEDIRAMIRNNLTHMNNGVFNINWQNPIGRSMLHFAIEFDENWRIVSELLSMGADPNIYDNDGYTPFHYAVLMGKIEIVKTFLQNGVDIHKPPIRLTNFTALHLTAISNDSVGDINLVIAKELVRYGAKINAIALDQSSNTEVTPLDLAKKWGDVKMIEYLTSIGGK
jgi:ankyrin repeat protein